MASHDEICFTSNDTFSNKRHFHRHFAEAAAAGSYYAARSAFLRLPLATDKTRLFRDGIERGRLQRRKMQEEKPRQTGADGQPPRQPPRRRSMTPLCRYYATYDCFPP